MCPSCGTLLLPSLVSLRRRSVFCGSKGCLVFLPSSYFFLEGVSEVFLGWDNYGTRT